MTRIWLSIVLCLFSFPARADITLKCDANMRCDGYLKNCVVDPYTFSVNINPQRSSVSIGGHEIKGDFSHSAEVAFLFTKYTIRINRFEYSAILTAEGEVRYGSCSKVNPAW